MMNSPGMRVSSGKVELARIFYDSRHHLITISKRKRCWGKAELSKEKQNQA